MMKDGVIIVSGGMDSITLLYERKDEIALGISFDYGSNHNAREIPFARMHCERLGIRHLVINLSFIHQYFKSSLLSGADKIPEGSYDDDNMKSTVVPFRNGIMLSIAVGIAESEGLKKVFIFGIFQALLELSLTFTYKHQRWGCILLLSWLVSCWCCRVSRAVLKSLFSVFPPMIWLNWIQKRVM